MIGRGVIFVSCIFILVAWSSVGGQGQNQAKPKETSVPPKPAGTASPPVQAPKTPEPKPQVQAKAKVIEKLGVVTVKVGVTNSDKRTADWKDLEKGKKLPAPLGPLDVNDKLVVKISTAKSLHQVFILLRNKASLEEVGFIAQLETEGSTQYKAEVDFHTAGFDSGSYEILLYLGDFLIEDSLEWVLGEVNFKTSNLETVKTQPAPSRLNSISYDTKPEIKHMFRQPEQRPPMVVSNAFTFLCLSPILVLFGMWVKIGVNMKNFPFTLSAIGFHVGLAAIFGVYGLFWLKLTMFEAFKWMAIPGLITFVTGNRLLSHIAENRGK